jgi:hypothetical protein
MDDRQFLRWGGMAAVVGGGLAVVGNLLHPRYDAPDVDVYRRIAASDRYRIADLVILVALMLTMAGFVAVSRSLGAGRGGPLAQFGRIAALAGGTIAIAEIGMELFGLKQAAETFATARPGDQVGSFWATNAVDHINTGLFNTWTIVFLGAAPLLLGAAALLSRAQPSWVGVLGTVGGALCVVVGFVNLVRADQTTLQIPFLIGSLLVTVWIIAAGALLWREPDRPVVTLPGQPAAQATKRTVSS